MQVSCDIMTLSVVFFGNSESLFSNRHFYALLWAKCQISAVVDVTAAKRTSTNTQGSFPVESFTTLANSRGISCFAPQSPNTPEFVAAMQGLGPDLFIAAGYMNLLKHDILSVPKIVAANWHASLLPAYRGKHPVFWALRNGERYVGLTVHVMDPGLDTGDILYQVRVRTRQNDTVGSAYDRIMKKSVPLVARLLKDAERGGLVRKQQPTEGASYYSSVKDSDFLLDWSLQAEVLRRRIQTSPGECYCEVAGHRVYFLDARATEDISGGSPGTLLKVGRSSDIATGGGGLRVRLVKVEDGEKSAGQAFHELGLAEGGSLAG